MSDTTPPASPCVRNCCLNERDVCVGCRRTLQEILDWHQMTPAQKQQVLERVARLQGSAFPQSTPRPPSDT